jgi:uncharacterized membrane protein YdfJ with MMPL/SSD domain
VLPLIFIIALGSDYTIHLLWSHRIVGDLREVFRTVGKAILFSFVTTLGPFIIFTGIQDLSVRKTMVATAIAIVFIFITTILTVPAVYKVEARKRDEDSEDGDDEEDEERPPEPPMYVAPQPSPEQPLLAVRRPKRTRDEDRRPGHAS